VLVTIPIPVVVPPGPVFLLLIPRELAKIAVIIAVSLVAPVAVVNDFFVVPHVIVGVIRVVYAVGMVLGTGHPRHG
jgi:hypothetical protein